MIPRAWCSAVMGVILSLSGIVFAADGLPDPTPPVEVTQKVPLNEALNKKITCEFEETSPAGVFEFFSHIAKVKIDVSPDVTKHPELFKAVTMKVTDMTLQGALNYACRLAGLRWEPDGNAVKVLPGPAAQVKLGKEKPDATPPEIKKDAIPPMPPDLINSGHIHIKFPEGGEVEVSGAVLDLIPELPQAVADLLEDPTRNGILAQKLPDEADLPEGVTITKIKELLAKAAPQAKVEYDLDTRLLMVLSDDPKVLRKAGAVLRALGIHRVEAVQPVEDADDGGAPPAKVSLRLPARRSRGILPAL